MTTDTRGPSSPPDPVIELSRHVDCVVMLLSSEGSEVGPAESWAASFARRIRVVAVTLDGRAGSEPESVVEGRLTRLSLPIVPPPERGDCLNRELRRLGLIRPLMWLEDLAYEAWFCTSYAPFKVVAAWDRNIDADRRSLSQADAIVVAPGGRGGGDLPPAMKDRTWGLPTDATDAHITEFCRLATHSIATRSTGGARLNIAVLYDHTSTHTNTVREYLTSFAQYSRHRFFYVPASNYHPNPPTAVDLSIFDAIVIHYSIRLCFNTLLPVYARALVNFGGLKLCFLQDEYDYTEIARQALDRFGVHMLFTCVPEPYRERVYSEDRFPHVEFTQVLTGYVPLDLETVGPGKPVKDRQFVMGYRGRALPPWYGDLSREKLQIGERVRAACISRGITVDIECDEDQRIYGERWYEFLGNCRATLGTESGSNVFDDHGDIRHAIQRAVRRDPDLTYETIHARYIAAHDGAVRMNQVSPRIFEAIALRTALVLFEGEYSGVIEPERHYIALKKDLSNIDDVLDRLADDTYLEGLTTRAWDDIVGSGRYSYRAFIRQVDAVIDRQGYKGTGTTLLTGVIAFRAADDRQWQWRPTDRVLETFAAFTTSLIDFEQKPPVAAEQTQVLVLRPEDRLQAVKWWIADALYRHPAVYRSVRTVYRSIRFVPRLVRRGYRGLSAGFGSPAEAEQSVGIRDTEGHI